LLPLIRGEREDLGLTIYGETIEHVVLFDGVPLRTLRKGRWKYIHQQPPALYDLEEDPNELSNLAATRPEVVESLRAELEALLAEGSPAPADAVVEIDSDQARRLRALGYVVGASAPEASTLESLELSGPPHARVAQDVDDYGSAASMLDWGFYEEAVNYLEPLAARYPTSVPILSLYARALNSLERPEAREVFERILERHPCDSDALVGVDAILDAAKDVEARLAHLRSAVEGCPESPEMLNNYAYELATLPREDLRNGPEALRFAERAVKLDGGSSPAVLDTLAAAHAEVGDFAAAIRVEEKAVRQAMAQGWASDAIAVLRANLDGYRKGRPLRED
jgi:tetratricopeptide (TPR) repeat protein